LGSTSTLQKGSFKICFLAPKHATWASFGHLGSFYEDVRLAKKIFLDKRAASWTFFGLKATYNFFHTLIFNRMLLSAFAKDTDWSQVKFKE